MFGLLILLRLLSTTQAFASRYSELNRGPLPYHGSALPLSYSGVLFERATRLELATFSLEG
jgi:hypothetical protein